MGFQIGAQQSLHCHGHERGSLWVLDAKGKMPVQQSTLAVPGSRFEQIGRKVR